MLTATFHGDRVHDVALKFTLVVTLASKAELDWLMHHNHPAKTVETKILKATSYGDRAHSIAPKCYAILLSLLEAAVFVDAHLALP